MNELSYFKATSQKCLVSENSTACLNGRGRGVCVKSILDLRHATPTVPLFHRNSFEYFTFTLLQPPCMYGKLNCVNATHIVYKFQNVCAPTTWLMKAAHERDDVTLELY